MELISRIITAKRHAEIKIVAMGCVHHGATGCNEAAAQYWYDKVAKTPNTYAIIGGDMIDGIREKDKRFTEEEVADWCYDKKWGKTLISRQKNYVLAKWKPLAHKILWLHEGNHEATLRRDCSDPVSAGWASALDIPYAGYSALSRLNIQSEGRGNRAVVLAFYTTHGTGSAKTDGAAISRISKYMDDYAADVCLSWHTHRRVITCRRAIGLATHTPEGVPKLRYYDRVGAVCGTFLDSHTPGVTSYGEVAGFAPVIPGPVVVHIKPFEDAGMRIWASQAVVERA